MIIVFLIKDSRSKSKETFIKHTSMAMLGLSSIDCYVRLEIMSDQQIALLCRPPKKIAPVNRPDAPLNQLIAADVPEPAAFIDVLEVNYGM